MALAPLRDLLDEIDGRLAATNLAREAAFAASRRITRLSAMSIRATHRGDLVDAARLMDEARELHGQLGGELREFPAVYWSGYVLDAQKELAEAAILLGLVGGTGAPSPSELQIEDSAYLNGLGEAAGELRRLALDRLRVGDIARAEWALGVMDEIYNLLVAVDFPDAVTGGLRRTTDMVRGVVERTRGDVTLMVRQHLLEEALARIAGELTGAQAPPARDAARTSGATSGHGGEGAQHE